MDKQATTYLVKTMRKVARDIIKIAEDLSHIEQELGRDKAGSDNDHTADWEHVERRQNQPFENMYDYARSRQPAFQDDDMDSLPASYKEANSASNRPQSIKSARYNGPTRKSTEQSMKKASSNKLVRKSSLQIVKELRSNGDKA